MFVELHIIQNFAPSCLNRDDTNTPKDCTFGGARRARISSQCWKRAIRVHPVFRAGVADRVGVRTRRLVDRIAGLVDRDPAEAKEIVQAVLGAAGYKMGEDGRTAVLLFLSPGEIDEYARIVRENFDALKVAAARNDEKPPAVSGEKPKGRSAGREKDPAIAPGILKLVKDLGSQSEAADIALFGRMVAESTNMNVDAACQVAHAFSTHAADVELDFFTAVDDLQPREEPGAGMMGVVEFNSACFYRYALLDVGQLHENLGGDAESAADAALAFCQAAVAAIPSGRQNSMAAQNPPSYVRVKVRSGGMPWSLANAFIEPVRAGREGDLSLKSIERLVEYDQRLLAMYGQADVKADCAASTFPGVGATSPLPELWSTVAAAIREGLPS